MIFNQRNSNLAAGNLKMLEMTAKNWAFIFLILLVAVFSFTGKNFFSLVNFQNIIHLSAIFLLLAAAETFVIITGGIDLSVGFVMGLSSVLSAVIMQKMHATGTIPPSISILTGSTIALVVCIIPGLINGFLIAHFNVPPFIATLGMYGIANGITLKMCKGFPIAFLPAQLVEIGNGYLFYFFQGLGFRFFSKPAGIEAHQLKDMLRIVPNSFIFLFLVCFILRHLLRNTKFGQHTYAIGSNMDASVRAGINTKKHIIKIYVLASFLAGLAGIVNVFQTGIGNYTPFGAMYELFAIAAVIIGGASLMGGKGSIFGSIIGVLILAVLDNGLLISGVSAFYRFIAVGLILILAIIIDQLFPDLF
ncbi:MAG: ABC transporter permease [Spirochaetes bacterium]|nr:ABC transporter permease [Spirochaetota bacterium]